MTDAGSFIANSSYFRQKIGAYAYKDAVLWYTMGKDVFVNQKGVSAVRKILCVLSAWLLFCFLHSSMSVAQPPHGFLGTFQFSPPLEAQAQLSREFNGALQDIERIAQHANYTNNPLARELQIAMQRLRGALSGGVAIGPTPTSRTPESRNPLQTAIEQAYVELARQYFFVFVRTSVEFPVMPEEGQEITEISEGERGEIFENFARCMKKISPESQIILINELIRSVRANEELKLLERLLDEILEQSATNRTPSPVQPVPFQSSPTPLPPPPHSLSPRPSF